MYFLILISILGSLLYSYYRYGIDYSKGMAEYASYNNRIRDKTGPTTNDGNCYVTENTWDSVINESKELWEALCQASAKDIILESSDVIHSLIKHLIITYVPSKIFCHWLCWFPIFILILPCSIKVAYRYQTYGCIRNHQNKNNCNHVCNYKNK